MKTKEYHEYHDRDNYECWDITPKWVRCLAHDDITGNSTAKCREKSRDEYPQKIKIVPYCYEKSADCKGYQPYDFGYLKQ